MVDNLCPGGGHQLKYMTTSEKIIISRCVADDDGSDASGHWSQTASERPAFEKGAFYLKTL
ncbi:MAG: hypothetical protein L3J79_10680 [Candidatus Marinimicrobia bacterium]|nr:hypothetical protein [Candidatus Neomarinimicrobiota bacterium]